MKKEEVKAIIFDVGGVLELSPQRKTRMQVHASGVHEEIAKKLRIDLDQYFDSIDAAYVKSIEGLLSRKKVIEILSKNLQTTPRRIEALYHKSYKKRFKYNKQLFKQAFKLKKKGYKIAILSDQWYLSEDVLIPKKIRKKFDVVVVSCDSKVKMRKPNSKIYRLVLQRLKLKPPQIVFIDNQKWNLGPAKKLGMKTILFRNNKQTFTQLKKLGVE